MIIYRKRKQAEWEDPHRKNTLRPSDKVKLYTCMIAKLVKMNKKDAYLHGIATVGVNPIQHE